VARFLKKKKISVVNLFVCYFQISLLQSMQSRYAKLEFDQARSLWMSFRPGRDGDGEADYQATFATLVEQVGHIN